jgi:HPt (histidine-containing phosphotransfer) domain-containing protein
MSEELFDLAEFKERVQDDTALLLELLDIFASDYEVKRQSLQEAISKGDCDELKSVAHSLKGASGNISAKSLRAVFVKLEDAAKSGDLSNTGDLLKQLDEVYTSLSARLVEVKKELS